MEISSPQRKKVVENILRPFNLNDDDYKKIMGIMLNNFNQGLGKETNAAARLKMYPTYVRSVPDGTESGVFLALDLGGTNFRVLLISLGEQEVKMESKIYLIPQHIMFGTGIQVNGDIHKSLDELELQPDSIIDRRLFDYIADCIFKFMKEYKLIGKTLPLGFTFSFPCRQEGLDRAILTQWTKGFKCEGVEGHNIVQLLQEAIQRRGDMQVHYLAVIDDTVGTLMSCAHQNQKCAIGLILGTGTNACYFERIENIGLWDGETDEPDQMIINTEWGALGDDGALDFIKTEYDRKVDRHSINPGRQVYEKMISGMYMGEIVRLVLLKLKKYGLVFGGRGSKDLETMGRFYTKYVSEIESDVGDGFKNTKMIFENLGLKHTSEEDCRIVHDVDDGFKNTKMIFEELGLKHASEEDCRIVQHVCGLVSTRAAYLVSAGIATLLNKMNRPDVVVAVDGSLYRFHPHFHDLMVEKITYLVNPGIKFRLMLSHDGSGKGAALVAAVADRLINEKKKLQAVQNDMDNLNVQENS